ncbi:MAG: hypothetical protein ACSLFB_06085 [Acidimicrobiales bacterium]
MTLLAVGSAKASPGASTLALALAATWPRESASEAWLLEADPDGGSIAALRTLRHDPGLMSLATSRDMDLDAIRAHVQMLDTDLGVLIGHASADQATAVIAAVVARLAPWAAAQPSLQVIADLGRVSPKSPAIGFARAADAVLLVLRPQIEEVVHVAHRAQALRDAGCTTGLVLIGERPYGPAEVAEAAQCEVFGVIADDPRGASILRGQPGPTKALLRSGLWRTSMELGVELHSRFSPKSVPPSPVVETIENQVVLS